MNDLHAAAHELTAALRKVGALRKENSLYVEKFPHMPYLLMGPPALTELERAHVSDFLTHRTPDGWEIGDTRREALARLESMTHMMNGFMDYMED